MPARARTTRTYTTAQRKTRARLLPRAYHTACPICAMTMLPGQALDLDHTLPVVLGGTGAGDRITHATCNRSTGATLGNLLRHQHGSQDW
jgi:hypothetical protein